MDSYRILIVGSFRQDPQASENITAAEQLRDLLMRNGYFTICTTFQKKLFYRIADTLVTIVRHRTEFNIAILPLYGTKGSFIWQEVAARLLRFLGKKIVLVVHGGSIPEQMLKKAKLFLKTLQRAHRIIAPSPFFFSFLNCYGFRSVLIENVLHLEAYPFQVKKLFRPRILWMRSFEDVYNPFLGVEVARLLQGRLVDFEMVMAGPDEGMLSQTKALARQYQLENCIHFPGYINHQQKLQYAADYDIYICTNTIDNAPVSVIEFMSLGLPIVATNVGGIPYLIEDGINGLLVPSNDASAMAEKIISIIHNPALGEKLATNAYNYSRRYDAAPVLAKWHALIKELEAAT